ncbi:MAG: hypothetical protein IJ214_12420 [Clostridia bacterium]|nr:hypothetical protein [Clostridia bacterium]
MDQQMNVEIRAPSQLGLSLRNGTSLDVGMQTGVTTFTDYERLSNKPRINGVELSGSRTAEELHIVTRDTTAGWNARKDYIPRKGEIILYTDCGAVLDETGREIAVPGIKIGDGQAFAVDLPFTDDGTRLLVLREIREHTERLDIHVTAEERRRWNAKLNYEVADEELIFTRN